MLLRRESFQTKFSVIFYDIVSKPILYFSGVVDTALVQALGDAQAVNDRLISRTALKRIGQPEEIAKCMIFLLSDQASYVNASVCEFNLYIQAISLTVLRF